MMTEIKRAMLFLWGMIYATSIWSLFMWWDILPEGWGLIPVILVAATTVAIVILTVCFLIIYWNED